MNLYLTKIKSLDTNQQNEIINSLNKERKDRFNILNSIEEKSRFLFAEYVCINLLCKVLDINSVNIKGTVGNKTYVDGFDNVSISRSYSDKYLFVGIDKENSIGVDVECISKCDNKVMKYFFTANEIKYIESCKSREKAFGIVWTLKESFIKCEGEGLKYPFHELDFTPNMYETSNPLESIYKENIRIKNNFLNSYYFKNMNLSVCSKKQCEFPKIELINY